MAETAREKYRKELAEAKAALPEPASPIEGIEFEIDPVDGITITQTDVALDWQDLKKVWKSGGINHPSITVSDETMDKICAYVAELKKAAALLEK